ncbi:MAG: hypothetical protein KC613_26610, partial [Myxococcales bacterium]|nr:hypothetical protein [Myxococcales bacterium]
DGGDGGAGGQGGGAVLPPVVSLESPTPNEVFIDLQPELRGRVTDAADNVDVRLIVDGAEPGEPLDLDDAGRFERRVTLDVGLHTLTVVALQGEVRGEASVTVRKDTFVRVSQGDLLWGEQGFTVVGLHAPDLLTKAHTFLANGGQDRVAELMRDARALGANVVRTRAYDDRPAEASALQIDRGMYNEVGLVALDHVIAKAGEQGIKLILPLIGPDDFGGINQYLVWAGYLAPIPDDRRRFFQAGEIREHFKTHLRTLVDRRNTITGRRYREDPTILAWEILDQPDLMGVFADNSGALLTEFYQDVSIALKEAAPNQLVATGDVGYDINPTPYQQHADALRQARLDWLLDGSRGVAWRRNHQLPSIDLATIHLGAELLGFPNDAIQMSNLGAAWIRGHATLASLENKPLVVLRARVSEAGGLMLPQRRAAMQAWADEVVGQELGGMVFGDVYPDGNEGNPAGWSYREGTDPSDPINVFADIVVGLVQRLARR